MLGWLIYSKADAKKNERYIDFYKEEGKRRGIEIILIFREELEFGIKRGNYYITYGNKETVKPDFAICRTIYPLLSKHLEFMGIPIFNNATVARICNDKAITYQYIQETGVTVIDSTFVKNHELISYMEKIKEPTVIKAVDGHGGSQVFLLDKDDINQLKMEEVLLKMDGSDCVIQPLTGKKHSDLRVYVIGREIIAAVLRTAVSGFRSNYSLGGNVRLYDLSHEEISIINKIIDKFDFGMVGIDFLIGDDNQLIFNEIEDVVGARMLYSCTNINLVGKYLDFILSKM